MTKNISSYKLKSLEGKKEHELNLYKWELPLNNLFILFPRFVKAQGHELDVIRMKLLICIN